MLKCYCSERALELRRLRYENRPQETRNNLEQLFGRRSAHSPNSEQQASAESPVVYRSQAVLNEISNLSSRAMVTGIQGSFRQQIEQTLQQRVSRPITGVFPVPPPVQIRPILPSVQQPIPSNPILDQTREQIVYEISDLVHSQLVSSTLQSAFRTRLENTVRERLARSGHDGMQTRQNILNILNNRVTSNVLRNDFSHLGITPANYHGDQALRNR